MDDSAREAARRERGDIPDSGAHVLRREVFPAGTAWVCAVCWEEYGTVRQEWPCRPALLAALTVARDAMRLAGVAGRECCRAIWE